MGSKIKKLLEELMKEISPEAFENAEKAVEFSNKIEKHFEEIHKLVDENKGLMKRIGTSLIFVYSDCGLVKCSAVVGNKKKL